MKQYQLLNTTSKLARVIGIGLIVIGLVTFFWPVECSSNFVVVGCGIAQAIQNIIGMTMILPGIILLIILSTTNSEHYVVRVLGVFVSFLAIIVIIVMLLPILSNLNLATFSLAKLSNADGMATLILIAIGLIEMLGFLNAGLFSAAKLLLVSHSAQSK